MISFPQFDWRAILGISKKICEGNIVLCHKPTWQFNKKFENMDISSTKILGPSFKQHTTHDLKLEIFWINWRMKASHSYDTMKAFIKFAKCSCFDLSIFWQIPKATINVFMCMTNHNISIEPSQTLHLWSTKK